MSVITKDQEDLFSGVNHSDVFRRIYYDLYSNSNTSRAETIVSDLSKLLLIKLAAERLGKEDLVNDFVEGKASVDDLLDLLKKGFPHLSNGPDSLSLDVSSLKRVLTRLNNLSLHNAPSHIVGDAFQALIGPKIRGDKGQFFTPHALVNSMVHILDPKPDEIVIDPACGTGGFLSATSSYWDLKHPKKQRKGTLIGTDKDKDLAYLANALIEIVSSGRGKVFNKNSLEFLSDNIEEFTADVVLTNPPFGSRIKIDDQKTLLRFDLGHTWNYSPDDEQWVKTNFVMSAQDPQILFLELCVKLLKPGGRMGIVLSEGIFGNKTYGYIWDYLDSQGRTTALLDNPRTTFQPSTDTKTNVLFFEKNKVAGNKDKNANTKIAVAINCGHDRRGRTQTLSGEKYANDYPLIAENYTNPKNNLWVEVKLDKYYKVPRFYLTQKSAKSLEKLGELVTIGSLVRNGHLSIRKGNEVGSSAYGEGEIPFIRTSDINNLEVSANPTKTISEDVYIKFASQQKLKKGDILMVTDGRYRIGKTAILHDEIPRMVVQSHVYILSLSKEAPVKPFELLYLLNLPEVQSQIRGLVFVQSTLGTLGRRFEKVQIPVPVQTKEWKKIINDFNETLEQRAKLLGKISNFANETEI